MRICAVFGNCVSKQTKTSTLLANKTNKQKNHPNCIQTNTSCQTHTQTNNNHTFMHTDKQIKHLAYVSHPKQHTNKKKARFQTSPSNKAIFFLASNHFETQKKNKKQIHKHTHKQTDNS